MKKNHELFTGYLTSTAWAITEEGLDALRTIYTAILERQGPVSLDTLKELTQEEADETGVRPYSSLHASKYSPKGIRLDNVEYGTMLGNGIALMQMNGPIIPRASLFSRVSGAVSVQTFVQDFETLYNDDTVKGIVVSIDSPGGDARGIGEGAEYLSELVRTNKKPVQVYASGLMCSAAYWLGAALGQSKNIIANSTAMIGSIGVVMTVGKKSDTEIDITSTSSPYKRVDPSTEEGVSKYKEMVDAIADVFVRAVADFRGVDTETVLSNYGQGWVSVGQKAKVDGLVDEIGTLDSVLKVMGASFAQGQSQSLGLRTAAVTSYPSVLLFNSKDEENLDMGLKDIVAGLLTPANVDAQAEGSDEQIGLGTDIENQAPTLTREELEDRYSAEAELFALKLMTSNKVLPAHRATAALDFITAKVDDALVGGTVKYIGQDGKLVEGTREQAVTAKYTSLSSHNLTGEAVKAIKDGDVKAVVLPEKTEKPDTVTAERREALLAATGQGKAVLNNQKGV